MLCCLLTTDDSEPVEMVAVESTNKKKRAQDSGVVSITIVGSEAEL